MSELPKIRPLNKEEKELDNAILMDRLLGLDKGKITLARPGRVNRCGNIREATERLLKDIDEESE